MWQAALFRNWLTTRSRDDFSDLTAAGEVRRGLEDVGFEVARVAGFGSKRHMSQAVFRSIPLQLVIQPTSCHPQIKKRHIWSGQVSVVPAAPTFGAPMESNDHR